MKQRIYLVLVLFLAFAACGTKDVKEQATIIETASGKWEMVWNDEFDYQGLPDSTRWSFDTDGNAWEWGNYEQQWYTANRLENASVENGLLSIKAQKEDWETKQYTSARLRTLNKGDWKYGRIEVCAKMPKGKGTWAAIWMMPSEDKYGAWPKSGEIDIMEQVGSHPDTIFSTVHTGAFNHIINTQVGDTLPTLGATEKFHTYVLEWEEHELRSYVDDQLYFTFTNNGEGSDAWPFDQKFHLLLNLAIGGSLGGEIDDSLLPHEYQIDYVRVYKKVQEVK